MTDEEWSGWSYDPADLLGCLKDGEGKASSRKLRLFAAACSRSGWHLLNDELSRQAVEALESLIEGRTTAEMLGDIRKAAEEAYRKADRATREQTLASDLAVLAMNLTQEPFEYCYEAKDASDGVVGLVAHSAIRSPDWGTAAGDDAAERAVAEQAPIHCHLLRDIFGPRSRRPITDRGLRTPAVVSLARAAYDERRMPVGHLDPARLSVLADALEDAGCTDQDILSHLRGAGPHVRGCWPVDLLLGKL